MQAFQGLLLLTLTQDTLEFSVVANSCPCLMAPFLWCDVQGLVFLFHAFLGTLYIISYEIYPLEALP